MERRLLTFIIASSAFFFAYISLRVMFVEPPPPEDQGAEVADAGPDAERRPEGEGDPASDDPAPDDPAPDQSRSGSTSQAVTEADRDRGVGDDAEADEPAAGRRPRREQRLTLGSMDPSTGYAMLVYVNSLGGGVERVELTARDEEGKLKYRRVDVRSGYLGYLAGERASRADGVLVNVVGPGTPADLATPADGAETAEPVPPGLRVGDRIVAVAGQVVASPDELSRVLEKTRPGQRISVEVVRTRSEPGAASDATPGGEPESASDETRDNDESPNGADESPNGADESPNGADDEPKPGLRPIVFQVTLSEHPLDLIRLAEDGGEDQVVGNLSRLSCLMTLSKVNRKSIAINSGEIEGLVDPTRLVWDGEGERGREGDAVELTLTLDDAEMREVGGESVRLRRRYLLEPGTFELGMEVEIENLGEQTQELAYRLEGVNGVTLEGWWYSNKISPNWSGAAARDIVYKTAADGHQLISGYTLHKQAKREPTNPDQAIFAPDGDPAARDLEYIGVDAQYFLAAYLTSTGGESDPANAYRRAAAGIVADAEQIPRHQERAVNTSFSLDSVVATVPPGGSLRDELSLFAGPKDPEILASYGLGDCVYYGWFSAFAKVLASLLHLLYAIVGNYGVAIILLTVIVRGAMFPLSRKAAINAQKMQELAPELKKIADRYKDDLEARMKAQRELQKRVGFNPLAGCLPMFLQLPIFIGLYRALSVDIELRQAAFSSATAWASNLAGPDMLAYWGDWLWGYLSGRGTGWLGPYFNILPVAVVLLFLLQQKLFMPPATDEQTAMTQKVMSWMTLVMGLFFFRVPAGLCIYFITSSLWGIAERVFVKKTLPQQKHFDAAVLEGSAAATAPVSSLSLADRLRQQMKPPEPAPEPPNRRKRPNVGKKRR